MSDKEEQRLSDELRKWKNLALESENDRNELSAEVRKLRYERVHDLSQLGEAQAEVERLTALVESNLNSSKVAMGKADAVLHERDSLKAEVESLELKATNLYNAMKVKMETDEVVCKARAIILQKEANETAFNFVIKELRAEVERLRKAGDAVVADLEHLTKSGWFDKCKSVKQWKTAKEGKSV